MSKILTIYVHPTGGVDIFIIFAFSALLSHFISGHFKEKYLSYLYQIWYGSFGEDSS